MRWRFKRIVVIGGVDGDDLEGLVNGVVAEAVTQDAVDETKAVLRRALCELELIRPTSEPISELCKVPGPPGAPRPDERTEWA